MISHHHRCVFIHISKAAGQSIEHVFVNLLGLTWETRAPLLLRLNNRPELGPPRLAHLKWWQYVRHKYMTQAQFDEYFKFSFVRNPWSRVVSIYKYFRFQERKCFSEFVMNDLRTDMWEKWQWFVGPQSEFVCDDHGRVMVDFLGRMETLQGDFDRVCAKIGLPAIPVPRVNVSPSEPQSDSSKSLRRRWRRRKAAFPSFATYQEYYDRASREAVAQLYQRDIELFGYTFDDARGQPKGSLSA